MGGREDFELTVGRKTKRSSCPLSLVPCPLFLVPFILRPFFLFRCIALLLALVAPWV